MTFGEAKEPVYTGEKNPQGQPHGNGRMEYMDGSLYTG